MKRTALACITALGLGLILAGCGKTIKPPTEADACFEAVPRKDGSVTFNKLTSHEPTMEACAASLEAMRERFLGLGGDNRRIVGVYNGNYLFLYPGGVQMSPSLDGMRMPFLVHGDNGQLVTPGAVEVQPGPPGNQ